MKVVVGIQAKLTKDGEKDVNLLIHPYYVGRTSPCVVIEDHVHKGLIGGRIDNLEQVFELQVAKRPGYVVAERLEIVAA